MNKRFFFITATLSVCIGALLPALAWAEDASAWPTMRMPSLGIFESKQPTGRYLLINASVADIKVRLGRRWPGIYWQKDSEKLSDVGLNRRWLDMVIRNSEDVSSLQKADIERIAQAYRDHAITADEAERLTQLRREWLLSDGLIERYRKSKGWADYVITKEYAWLNQSHHHEDTIALTDMQRILNSATPVTLLWLGSQDLSHSMGGFEMSGCRTGLGCLQIPVPVPGLTTASSVDRKKFQSEVLKAIADLPRQSPQASAQALDWHPSDKRARSSESPIGLQHVEKGDPPKETVPAIRFGDGKFEIDNLVATVDDKLLLYGRGSLHEISWQDGLEQMRRLDLPSEHIVCVQDGYWAIDTERAVHVTRTGMKTIRWQMDEQGYTHDSPDEWNSVGVNQLATYEGEGFAILRTDATLQKLPLPPGRAEAFATVFDSGNAVGRVLQFADRLLWNKTQDGFISGLDIQTQRYTRTLRASEVGPFGSIEGGWSMDCTSDCTVSDIDGKAPSWKFEISYTPRIARSANGKLIGVVSEYGSSTIWNMKTRTPTVVIAPPPDARPIAMAFSWSGDKVWLLSEAITNRSKYFLQTWNVPQELRDPASSTSRPDTYELRQ